MTAATINTIHNNHPSNQNSNQYNHPAQPKPPTLYLIHGWGMNQAVWQLISQKLAQHFNIIYLDLPGYGESADHFPANYSLENISNQVSEKITQKGILLGWSLGGLVAQYIAIHQPKKISGLVCLATTPKFEQTENWPGIKAEVLNAFQLQLSQNYARTIDKFLAIQMMGSETARQDIKQIKALLMQYPAPVETVLSQGLALLNTVDLSAQINQINSPTLRLYGKLDSLVPIKAVDLIQKLHSSSQAFIFAKASHAPFISHPDEFVSAVVSFKSHVI